MFVPESPARSEIEIPLWQPGQALPIIPQPSQQPDDIRAILQSMQHTIESNFEDIKGQLSELESRISSVEKKQQELPCTPSSSEESVDGHRRKRNPSELQVSKYTCLVSFM